MQIEVFCAYPDEEIFANVRANSLSCTRLVEQVPAHEGHAVIVGGGPSIAEKLPLIQKRAALGQKVFALNGACSFLNRNGMIPDYQVVLESSPHMQHMMGDAKEYLFASQCHPSTFAAKSDAYMWHLGIEGMTKEIPGDGDRITLIGGGLTVGLSSMCLAYCLGYRKLHLFGYDSSFRDKNDHAYEIEDRYRPRPLNPAEFAIVTLGGKQFKTSLGMAKQAEMFPPLCNELIDLGCIITVDCDGLIMTVMDEIRKQNAAAAA